MVGPGQPQPGRQAAYFLSAPAPGLMITPRCHRHWHHHRGLGPGVFRRETGRPALPGSSLGSGGEAGKEEMVREISVISSG